MIKSYTFKPCFYPWSFSDIAFDSILAMSLTCTDKVVYLSKYVKTKGHVELLFTDAAKNHIAALNTNLDPGIGVYSLYGKDGNIIGTVSLIDTPLYETYIEPESMANTDRLRLSPLCFTSIDLEVTDKYINVNGEDHSLNSQEIFIDDNLSASIADNSLIIKARVDKLDIEEQTLDGDTQVLSVGTKDPLTSEYVVQLPESIKIDSVVSYSDYAQPDRGFNSVVTLRVESTKARCYSDIVADTYEPTVPAHNVESFIFLPCFTKSEDSYVFDLEHIEENIKNTYNVDNWDMPKEQYDA